eukprot:CAMPEP_0202852264 /NCGR_PEP_ID=MMETSP1389-20130828/88594_1 /ASSEMBLY_ACC=CAM_ASM_000865 /TAXON_ID=302021 /ORGANISM="Rhodomonas sp., Strain CCMP768" /LENGTH=86 /DNA_ID=CAMNT_0049530695 /DNA_START=101 /DNA_END=362 /DNA_ORIENTATION=+
MQGDVLCAWRPQQPLLLKYCRARLCESSATTLPQHDARERLRSSPDVQVKGQVQKSVFASEILQVPVAAPRPEVPAFELGREQHRA